MEIRYREYDTKTYKYIDRKTSLSNFFEGDKGYHNGIRFVIKTVSGCLLGKEGACHAGLNYLKSYTNGEKIVGLYTQLRPGDPSRYESALKYWDAIFDKKISPWSIVLEDGVKYIKSDKDGRVIGVYLPLEQSTPTQVLGNLCIASRFPFEHKNIFPLFAALIGAKIHPRIAIALTLSVRNFPNNNYRLLDMDIGHHPFNRYIFAGNLITKKLSYNTEQIIGSFSTYTPCNSIWSYDTKKDYIKEALKKVPNKISEITFKEEEFRFPLLRKFLEASPLYGTRNGVQDLYDLDTIIAAAKLLEKEFADVLEK